MDNEGFKPGDVVTGKPGFYQEGLTGVVVTQEEVTTATGVFSENEFAFRVTELHGRWYDNNCLPVGTYVYPENVHNYELVVAASAVGGVWNSSCPRCAAPAYQGFTEVECSKHCCVETTPR